MRRSLQAAGLVLAAFSISAQAADNRRIYALEDRVDYLEQNLSNNGTQRLAEDIRNLQNEVRQLRGEVERLQYENDQAKVRQREMYLDLERRIQALEQQGSSPATAVAPMTETPGQGGAPSASQAAPAAASGGQNEEQQYLAAFEKLKQGRYPEAIQAFSSFLQQHPRGEYSDNAQYWLGEAYYVSRDFPQALASFQQLVEVYPQSGKLPGALLKIGYINYERGEYEEARLALSRVTRDFPESSAASLARQRLQRMDTEGR